MNNSNNLDMNQLMGMLSKMNKKDLNFILLETINLIRIM